jgi:hypothetical protein
LPLMRSRTTHLLEGRRGREAVEDSHHAYPRPWLPGAGALRLPARRCAVGAGDVKSTGFLAGRRRWSIEGRFSYLLVGSTGISEPLPAAEPRLGRRTALTFPLLPPPQKNWSPPSDSSPEPATPGGISSLSRTSPVRGSTRRKSLSSRSQVPCQSSPSIQVTPVSGWT